MGEEEWITAADVPCLWRRDFTKRPTDCPTCQGSGRVYHDRESPAARRKPASDSDGPSPPGTLSAARAGLSDRRFACLPNF